MMRFCIPWRGFVRCFLRISLLSVIAFGLAVAHVRSRYEGNAQVPAACALVFGAAVHSMDDPGPGIARRVRTAAALYNDGLVEKLILTGGKGSAEQESEAQVMRGFALSLGVPSGDIALEEHATSTWENLLYSRPLAGECDSVIAVSDRYHLARIEFMARRQGTWDHFSTLPAEGLAKGPFEMRSLLRESVAFLYYLFQPWKTFIV